MIKDKSKYNEYMNDYMKRRYSLRREKAIAKLGGKCVHCGSCNNLHFDHIDPSTKVATIARMSSMSAVKFNAEIDKCQLLCEDCHKAKSNAEGSTGNKNRTTLCDCGRVFTTIKQFAGHRTWCKTGR